MNESESGPQMTCHAVECFVNNIRVFFFFFNVGMLQVLFYRGGQRKD